jgi:hypothetical protein
MAARGHRSDQTPVDPMLSQLRFFVIFVIFVLKFEARRPHRRAEPPRS